jgi:CheY-like chemotaxis protein
MTPKKVLLAEDDPDDQRLFCDCLQHRNDIVMMPMAGNGVVLLDMLEVITTVDGLPDLIVLDQNMPKRTGLQTLRLLKQTSRYNPIPVMIYSTYIDPQLTNDCYEAGASVVMSKPISREGYNKMMDAFLKTAV